VVLGLSPEGRKRFEGDARTPEGRYHVTSIRKHRRWHYFIAINYPNSDDVRAYRSEIRAGTVPTLGGRPLGIGAGLGIHGNDRPGDQTAGRDWTKGCVAMDNGDLELVGAAVGVGTPVVLLK